MKNVIEKVNKKIVLDMSNPFYHTQEDYLDDLQQFQTALKQRYNLDLTLEKCCIIWENFSSSWSASFMIYSKDLVDTALKAYVNIHD